MTTRFRAALAVTFVCFVAVGCGGGGEATESQDSPGPQGGAAQVDFSVTGLAALPGALRREDTLTVTATIHNTGSEASGDFLVRSFLKQGTNCDDATYPIGTQTLSIPAGGSAAFQAGGAMTRVRDVGTYYVCLVLDALDDIEELDESNNTVGGTLVEVEIVECVNDTQCDDANMCTDDVCLPLVGCDYIANLLPCDDGLFCTVGDTCGGGSCQGGGTRTCVDTDLCDGTLYCDENVDACVNGQAPPPCDDGDQCNGLETCDPADGTCRAGTPEACDLLLNNGAAPPTASNQISDTTYDEHSDEVVFLRDLGCPIYGEPDSFCPIGSGPTTLEVASGGRVGDLRVFDGSILSLTGGSIVALTGAQNARHELDDGEVEYAETFATTIVTGGSHQFLSLRGDASIEGGRIDDLELDARVVGAEGVMRGGHVGTLHFGAGSSLVGGRVSMLCARDEPGVIYGRDFDVTGGAYGPVPGSEGFIHGVLESGEVFDATYHQDGALCYHPTEGSYTTSGSLMLLPPRSTFIANGLGPEVSALNVIDGDDVATLYHDVYVRDTGCPTGWPSAFADDPCFLAGAVTEVAVAAGANVPGTLYAFDDSEVTIRGGMVSNLSVAATARIEIWGTSFAVDGVTVPFGNVLATNGVITGTLASGDPFVANFDRADLHTPGTHGTLYLRAFADIPAGTGVVGDLFGGLGSVGGVEVELDVDTGGLVSGSYEYIELEDISHAVPDFLGLAVAARGFQDRYQVWELEFTGVLSEPGSSVVRFAYDPAFVQPGQQLIIFAWNGEEWVRMKDGVVIDEVNHTIEIEISEFSIFALIVREYMVPALSLFGTLVLLAGLAASGHGFARARQVSAASTEVTR